MGEPRAFPFPWHYKPFERALAWACYHAVLMVPHPWDGWRNAVVLALLPRAGAWAHYWTEPSLHGSNNGVPDHE